MDEWCITYKYIIYKYILYNIYFHIIILTGENESSQKKTCAVITSLPKTLHLWPTGAAEQKAVILINFLT